MIHDVPPMAALAATGVAAMITFAAIAVAAIISSRRPPKGWTDAANHLGRRITQDQESAVARQQFNEDWLRQLESHVRKLAADAERTDSNVAQLYAIVRPMARRAAIDETAITTVRLSVPAPEHRTQRLPRVPPMPPLPAAVETPMSQAVGTIPAPESL